MSKKRKKNKMAKSTGETINFYEKQKDGKKMYMINGKEYESLEAWRAEIAKSQPKKQTAELKFTSDQLKEAIKRVWDAYSNDDLRDICAADESEFGWAGEKHTTPTQSFYYYKRTGSSILAVAHLDSVQSKREHFKVSADGLRVWSPVLDDRLGVYTITRLLPALGIKCDTLLTTGEETGCSTAKEFSCPVSYNWAVEFDRGGGDAVTYKYDDPEWTDMLESQGYEVGYGIYSDIQDLGHLGCSAVNIGVGYQHYHSHDAYFDLPVYIRNVAKFLLMYEAQKDKLFYHSAPSYKYGRYSTRYDNYGYGRDWYSSNTSSYYSGGASKTGSEALPSIPARPVGDLSDVSETESDYEYDFSGDDEVSFRTGERVLGYDLHKDLSIDPPEKDSDLYLIVSVAPFVLENESTGQFWQFDENNWGWSKIAATY